MVGRVVTPRAFARSLFLLRVCVRVYVVVCALPMLPLVRPAKSREAAGDVARRQAGKAVRLRDLVQGIQ